MNRVPSFYCYGGPYDGKKAHGFICAGKVELPDPRVPHPRIVHPPPRVAPPPTPVVVYDAIEVAYAYPQHSRHEPPLTLYGTVLVYPGHALDLLRVQRDLWPSL